MRAAGVALAALILASGCGETATTRSAPLAASPPESNQKVLTRSQSERLVRWASSLRSCLGGHGYATGKPEPARTRIELSVPQGTAFRPLLQAGIACGESLGGPPKGSSLQTFRDRIVLYLPKQCLLDPKVAA